MIDGYLDILLYNLLARLRTHSSTVDGKPSWSRGSKGGPNHDPATTMFHRCDGSYARIRCLLVAKHKASKSSQKVHLSTEHSFSSLLDYPHGLEENSRQQCCFWEVMASSL